MASDTTSPTEEKDRPIPALKPDGMEDGSIKATLRDILEALQDSTIAGPTAGKDDRSRFWGKYKRIAEEHDSEFLERYGSDMDIVLIFAGLFSAVSTSFIIAMEPSLLPDPSDTTNALLFQLVQILGNSTTPGQVTVPAIPVFPGPSRTDIWVQTVAYLSLASSLLAAFGAVMGKQWLGYYKANRYGRGTLEQRGIRRQERFDGLKTWYFDALLQSFPLLIQFSLFLFALSLSGHMWSQEKTIASVIIATTVFGVLFYLLTLFASLLSPACPYQSPFSTIFRSYIIPSARRRYRFGLIVRESRVYRVCAHQLQASRQLMRETKSALKAVVRLFKSDPFSHCSGRKDIEKGSDHLNDEDPIPSGLLKDDAASTISLEMPKKPSPEHVGASSVLWLLETSTDPEVLLVSARMVTKVEWQTNLKFPAALDQLEQAFSRDGFGDAHAYARSRFYLYFMNEEAHRPIVSPTMRILGKEDHMLDVFDVLLSSTWSLSPAREDNSVRNFLTRASKQDFLQVLYLLPYATFEFTSVDAYLQSPLRPLILGVIPNILDGQNNLTAFLPGVSDCAMVIGRLLGLQFSLENKRKLDKGWAYTEMMNIIYAKLIGILSRQQQKQNIRQCATRELEEHTENTGNCLVQLEEHLAMDCLPFIPSLLSSVVVFRTLEFSPMDGCLFVCKVYFDKSIQEESDQHLDQFDRLRSKFKYIPCLQNSIRIIANALKKDSQSLEERSSTVQKFTIWDNDHQLRDIKESKQYHPWLLDYLKHLCATFQDDISHLQEAFLVSTYALVDLRNSATEIQSYLETITFCLGADKPDELRRTALHALYSKQDIFLVPVEQLATYVDATLSTISVTLLASVSGKKQDHVEPDNDSDQQKVLDTSDLDDCIYRYVKLIFKLAQIDNWHGRLTRDGHLKAAIALSTPRLMQTYPFLVIFHTSIATRIASSSYNSNPAQEAINLEENTWQSIVTDFWTALASRTGFLEEIYTQEEWSDFIGSLPAILLLVSERTTSMDIVESILKELPKVQAAIQETLTYVEGDPATIMPLLNDFQERLERRRRLIRT